MAQASKFTLTSSSETVGIPENYADRIFHLAPWETQLLTALGMDSLPTPCTNPTYHYLDIEDRPARTTLATAVNTTTQTIVMSEAVFAAGEVIQMDEETILLGTTSDNLTFSTCTRSHGTTAGQAHIQYAPAISLGKPRAQGAAAGSTGDRMIQPNDITNYTQIFSKDVVVSGTSEALNRYGREGTEKAYQEMFQSKTLKKELQGAVIWNKAVAPSTTSTAGEMDGIYERIRTNSVTDISDGAQSVENMEDLVEVCQDWGGMPNVVACGLYPKRIFDAWGPQFVQHNVDPMSPVNMQYGTNVSKLYIGGVGMDILVCPDLHTHILVLDTTRIGVGPLQGRAFNMKDLDDGGDRKKSMIVGEYTCAVPNSRAHAMLSSVKFT